MTLSLSRRTLQSCPLRRPRYADGGASQVRGRIAPCAGRISCRRVRAGVAVDALASWMAAPAHVKEPYPTPEERRALAAAGGITERQVDYWLGNARKRVWKVCACVGPLREALLTRQRVRAPRAGRSKCSPAVARRRNRGGARGKSRGPPSCDAACVRPPHVRRSELACVER
jgi:hypothetical protein